MEFIVASEIASADIGALKEHDKTFIFVEAVA
jgi:hypothetical protein